MSNMKQVKVDNWGIFFLQRLKHFFNRTDYCDLTLQFEDCAQLKVHRLVLNACTEYFDVLERTCEIFDDVIIMPNDLQADVVVPIVNFMYTGQLEYDFKIFDRLYLTAQVMNMTVLTKLLDSQRSSPPKPPAVKKEFVVMNEQFGKKSFPRASTSNDFTVNQRNEIVRKRFIPGRQYGPSPGHRLDTPVRGTPRSRPPEPPRPTRYEVPDELDNDDIFESSFADISYESQPLMRSTKKRQYQDMKPSLYDEASSSRKFEELRMSTSYKRPRTLSGEPSERQIEMDHVNEFTYQQKLRSEYIEQDRNSDDDNEIFDPLPSSYENKVTIQEENSSYGQASPTLSLKATPKDSANSLDHAKIISEVLKKYPHLVKSNKNIKLKIMSGNNKPGPTSKHFTSPKLVGGQKVTRYNDDHEKDWTYVAKNMNSEAMAKLVSLGAENITGPWLCLICGTPGKALNFLTYNKFYRHLVEVHKERISANICEHCGYKSGKRNHLLHHMYTKHNIPPPSTHSFPKCTQCPYIALTEAFLIKHKMTHSDNREFSCSVCSGSFRTRTHLLTHIQNTGHKISRDRKPTNQCVYCSKIFLRETNLYTHLKLAHKEIARKDGIIDNSDEDEEVNKYQDNTSFDLSNMDEEHVNIKEEEDGKIQIISRNNMNKPGIRSPQKLLNVRLGNKGIPKKSYPNSMPIKKEQKADGQHVSSMESSSEAESLGNVASGIAASLGLVDRIVVLNDNEYILQAEGDPMSMEHTIQMEDDEMILSDIPSEHYVTQQSVIDMPTTTRTSQIMSKSVTSTPKVIRTTSSQPIQIVVSNSQQYKTASAYSNAELKTTAAPTTRFVSSQVHNIDLENSTQEMMVLHEDYNVGHTVTNDGSNIVVVYSHPVEASDNHILEVNSAQYEGVPDAQEIESNMERIHGEEIESETVLSEQGLVHETVVDSWQEGNVHHEQETGEEENQGQQELIQENVEDVKGEEIQEESLVAETQSDEVVETSQVHVSEETEQGVEESGEQQNDTLTDNDATVIENELSVQEAETEEVSAASDELDGALHVEEVPASQEQLETSCDEAPQNGDLAEQEMDVDNVQEYQVQENGSADDPRPKQRAEQLTLEWSDDETTKEPPTEASAVEAKEDTEAMEVEESIENIEEEVNKQNEEELNENDSQDVVGEKAVEPSEPHEEENEDTESSVDTKNSQDEAASKEKAVEKISHLLNDWEDNDSQAEAMEVDGKKVEEVEEVVAKKDTITKLVSDWEEDEEEK